MHVDPVITWLHLVFYQNNKWMEIFHIKAQEEMGMMRI